MIFEEAEDFELYVGGKRYGRYMVSSKEPYEVDLLAEMENEDEVEKTIERLLSEGRIEEYKPNFTVHVSLFNTLDTIKDNRDWKYDFDTSFDEPEEGIQPVSGLADDNGKDRPDEL